MHNNYARDKNGPHDHDIGELLMFYFILIFNILYLIIIIFNNVYFKWSIYFRVLRRQKMYPQIEKMEFPEMCIGIPREVTKY